jgi:hypothetical protein
MMAVSNHQPFFVTPAQAGVQLTSAGRVMAVIWIPAFAGMTRLGELR